MGKKHREKRREKEAERQAAGGNQHVPKKFRKGQAKHGKPRGR